MAPPKSWIWDHFTQNNTGGPRKNAAQIVCKHCRWISHHRSIERLQSHLVTCSSLSLRDREELVILGFLPRPSDGSKKRKVEWLDTLESEGQDRLESKLLVWLCHAGLPLSVVDNDAFKDFFKDLRPAFRIPARKKLSTTLLDQLYNQKQSELLKVLAAAPRISLISDGWTNTRNESIINYLASTGNETFFYKSVYTNSESHSATYIAQGVQEVIQELGTTKVIGLTTDNAANMRSAWSILQAQHPALIPIGCCSHRLNLLGQDLMKIPRIEPLWQKALELAKWFKARSLATAVVKRYADASSLSKFKAFQLPGNTRWQGRVQTIRPLLHNWIFIQQALLELKSNATYNKDAGLIAVYNSAFDVAFHDDLQQLLQICGQLVNVIISFESRKPKLSSAFYYLGLLQKLQFDQQLIEPQALTQLFQKRLSEAYHPLMCLAYLADPATRDQKPCNISNQQILETSQWIAANWVDSSVAEAGQFLGLMTCLRDRRPPFNDDIRWTAFQSMELIDWWDLWSDYNPRFVELCKIALTIPPTSGEAERSWSTFSFVHNKLRNKLQVERVNKLVFLHSALRKDLHVLQTNKSDVEIFAQAALELLSDDESI